MPQFKHTKVQTSVLVPKELDQLIQKEIKEWEKRLQEIPAEIENYKKELDQLIELNKSLKETFARFGLEFQL